MGKIPSQLALSKANGKMGGMVKRAIATSHNRLQRHQIYHLFENYC